MKASSVPFTLVFCLSAIWALSGMAARAAQPAASAAVARGADIARNVCSACHQATSDQLPRARGLPDLGPPFTEIASRPDTSYKSLCHFIAKTHWDLKSLPPTMPNPMLTESQVSDVAHYIMSLRAAPAGKP